MKSLNELTTDGIKLFNMTCVLNAAYSLTISTCAYMKWFPEYFGEGSYLQSAHMKLSSAQFFAGAGFVSSFAAIGNIMRIEHRFDEQLEQFQPFWKFWGTKVLVSLAFVQTVVLGAVAKFSSLSTERSNMLFAAMLCYECFLVSLLHMKAWNPEAEWYQDHAYNTEFEDCDDGEMEEYLENMRFHK